MKKFDFIGILILVILAILLLSSGIKAECYEECQCEQVSAKETVLSPLGVDVKIRKVGCDTYNVFIYSLDKNVYKDAFVFLYQKDGTADSYIADISKDGFLIKSKYPPVSVNVRNRNMFDLFYESVIIKDENLWNDKEDDSELLKWQEEYNALIARKPQVKQICIK